MLERVDARDHRRLVEPDADPVPELETEARLLVREAELLGGRPDLRDPVRRHARPDELDRSVEPFAALLVRVELRLADAADVERAVVARPVAHERMDDVEERLVARPQEPVGEHVRMRIAAVARDGVDRLHLLRSHLEQQLVRPRDDLVLVDARPQHPVDLLVDRVDEPGRLVEERDLLRGLDLSRLEEHLRAVRDVHAGALERLDRDEVSHVDSERLVLEAELAQLVRDPLAEPVRDPGLDGHRAAHRRDTGAEVLLGSHGANSWWWRAADPKSHRIGSAPRGSRVKRAFLSRAHSPMCVLVTYRMLFGSNSSTAPRSDASSDALARSRRSWRSRGKSMRCSQSTARVASGEPTVLFRMVTALPPR